MRIKLAKGKQKELILRAKGKRTWAELAHLLKTGKNYVSNDIKNENVLLSEEFYKKLVILSGTNFDNFIIDRRGDNWGRIKGAQNSSHGIKEIKIPELNDDFAEAVGILLGDGHISEAESGKGYTCYFITIAGNYKTDKDYMVRYVPLLFERLLGCKGRIQIPKDSNGVSFTINRKNVVEFLKSIGLKSGDKKKNNQGIPGWIKKDKKLLSRCIRGLVDTDGSVCKFSRDRKGLRINFTSYIPHLLGDVRNGLIWLGFTPSKIIGNKQIYLSKQSEIDKYIREIGFSNQKNLSRVKSLKE